MAALGLVAACGGDPPPVEPDPPRAVAISISPSSASFASIGDTQAFTATLTDQYGAEFNGTVTWTSDNTDVFAVDAAGLATAVGDGTGTVRASYEQLSATARVTVRQVVVSLTVSPDRHSFFAIGETATFTATAADANGFEVADAVATWESSAPLVATVDANGLVTAVGDGEARITATVDGVAGSALVVAKTVIRILVQRLDTTVVVPIDAGGQNWTYAAEESRWLPEMPVANLRRRATPPGVVVEVLGPGWVRIDPTVGGERVRAFRVEVAPPQPFVVSLEQEDWPDTDVVTVRGYAVDRIALPAFRVGGEPALEAFGDSVEMRFMPSPLNGGECMGDPVGTGVVEVLGAQVPGPATVNRLAGPVAVLERGESFRIGGADSCVRLWAQPGAAYVLAGVERSAIDASRYAPSPVSYSGGAPYAIEVTDRTVQPSARRSLRRVDAPHVEHDRHPAPPRSHESMYWAQSDSLEGLDTRTEKWKVGDEFLWYTNDNRTGVFRVVELYPPNIVFAVFKEDIEEIWTAARAAQFDEIMNWLGSEQVQDLYKTVFGPRVPITNTKNEQMVVMYNDGSDEHSTGVMIHNIDGERTTTTVHMRDADWGGKGWYHNLAAHELAHAWDRRNLPGFVGPWSSEGIANWFADENSRLATNTPLDANWNVEVPLRGFRLRMPWYGDSCAATVRATRT